MYMKSGIVVERIKRDPCYNFFLFCSLSLFMMIIDLAVVIVEDNGDPHHMHYAWTGQ
jgi:hypothetical protein